MSDPFVLKSRKSIDKVINRLHLKVIEYFLDERGLHDHHTHRNRILLQETRQYLNNRIQICLFKKPLDQIKEHHQ